ncbi:DUF262 domain-containing protein [Occultella kanbiaonis]|uniref:GmrSD restriction endonuclease domain-containing protein n=1 Tax=Occultella kanbiaonis TaxID=2675754 RepID=UPI0013D37137|nr:DUF262 domain-containing protein [Occultella kanbiaonis]
MNETAATRLSAEEWDGNVDQALTVTKTLYTAADFLEWQRERRLNLRPYFQRGSVWNAKAKSYLIDTLLRGFPIPIIYLQVKTDRQTLRSMRQVVDGQQRLRTILAYLDITSLSDVEDRDRFTIMRTHNRELAGKSFSDLPQELRDRLLTTEMSVHILPDSLSDESLLQLFARLNSTGTRLNDQEQRNAAFHGEFKTLVYRLSYAQLDRWRDWSTFSAQALAQMREVEFMSDLVIMLVQGPGARSKGIIDKFYDDHDDTFPEADQVAELVPQVFDDMASLLGPDSHGNALGVFRTQSWLYSIFSLLAMSRYGAPLRGGESPIADSIVRRSNVEIRKSLVRAEAALASGQIPKRVADSLRGASTDRSSRASRLEFLANYVSG